MLPRTKLRLWVLRVRGNGQIGFRAVGRQPFAWELLQVSPSSTRNRQLLHCQHEQGSVIPKLRAAELRYLREQLLIHARGGIRCMCFGEGGDFLHSEFFASRPLGFGNAVGEQKKPVAGAEVHA